MEDLPEGNRKGRTTCNTAQYISTPHSFHNTGEQCTLHKTSTYGTPLPCPTDVIDTQNSVRCIHIAPVSDTYSYRDYYGKDTGDKITDICMLRSTQRAQNKLNGFKN